MAELTDDQWSAEVADIVADLVAGTITAAEASTRLAAATRNWPTRTLSNADLAARVSRFLARLNGLIAMEGAPDASVGELNAYYFDTTSGDFYGPKKASGWGNSSFSLVGPPGPAAVISGASLEMLPPGSAPKVTMGGSSLNRTFAFGVPAARDGTDGVVPNVTAQIAMIAHGGVASVTRSGPDAAPVLTFNLPSPMDGLNAKEVEYNKSDTHLQWRRVGDTEWIDWVALTDLMVKGDKGDAFEFDAYPADMAGRAAFDNEGPDFVVLVMDTGMVYARVGATPGVWSDGFAFGQTQNAILQALSDLNATEGVLVQTGPATFAKRALGAATGASILDRDGADTRYRQIGGAVPLADITGLVAALGEKADAGAVLAMLGGKQDKLGFTPENAAKKNEANGYAGLGADAKIPNSLITFPAAPTVPVKTNAAGLRALADDAAFPTPAAVAGAMDFTVLVDAATISINPLAGPNFYLKTTAAVGTNRVLAFTGGKLGQTFTLTLDTDAANRTIGFSGAKFPKGTVPVLSKTTNTRDKLTGQVGYGGGIEVTGYVQDIK